MFTKTLNEKLLRDAQRLTGEHSTGLIVKDGVRTWGMVKWGPVTVLPGQEGGFTGVKSASARACVVDELLPGVTATGGGIGDTVSVDFKGELVDCVIIDVTTPAEAGFDGGEDDGDLLALILKRA